MRFTDSSSAPHDHEAAHPCLCRVAAGIAARANYTDRDFVDFLVNVECLEGQFDTWGTFGHGFLGEHTP